MHLLNDFSHGLMEAANTIVSSAAESVTRIVDQTGSNHGLTVKPAGLYYTLRGPMIPKAMKAGHQIVCPHVRVSCNDRIQLDSDPHGFLRNPCVPEVLGTFLSCSISECHHGWHLRMLMSLDRNAARRVWVEAEEALKMINRREATFINGLQFYPIPCPKIPPRFTEIDFKIGPSLRTNPPPTTTDTVTSYEPPSMFGSSNNPPSKLVNTCYDSDTSTLSSRIPSTKPMDPFGTSNWKMTEAADRRSRSRDNAHSGGLREGDHYPSVSSFSEELKSRPIPDKSNSPTPSYPSADASTIGSRPDIPTKLSDPVSETQLRTWDECEEKLAQVFEGWSRKNGGVAKSFTELIEGIKANDSNILGPLRNRVQGLMEQIEISANFKSDEKAMKKVYMKVLRIFHPDKLTTASVEEQYRGGALYDMLNMAFTRSGNLMPL